MSVDKEFTNPVVVAVVVVILLLGVVWRFMKKPEAPAPVSAPAVVKHEEKVRYSLIDKNKSYDINDHGTQKRRLNASSIVLEGITISPEQTATFNGQIYRVGDMVYGCKIADIHDDEVLIEKNGEIKYLKMGEMLDK